MKKIIYFVIIYTLISCNFSKKPSFSGKIQIAIISYSPEVKNKPEYFLLANNNTYHLNFTPNTITEGLSNPYPNADCHIADIGKDKAYLHSNSSYLIEGEVLKDSTTSIIVLDGDLKFSSEKPVVNKLNVVKIKELSRGSGICEGYKGVYGTNPKPVGGGGYIISMYPTKLSAGK